MRQNLECSYRILYMNFYITGSTGFLGGEILRQLRAVATVLKPVTVYVPIRDKRGQSGPERFEILKQKYLGTADSMFELRFCAPSAPVPSDAKYVILNAFSVSFTYDIRKAVLENVTPILDILDGLDTTRQRVTFVSTAYVQPPLPYPSTAHPIPFDGINDPEAVYNAIVNGERSWADVCADPRNNPQTTLNAYIYAKTLTEHLLLRHRNVRIVRPSIITASRDGLECSTTTPPYLCMLGHTMGVFRFTPGAGITNWVHVDDVAQQIVGVSQTDGKGVVMSTSCAYQGSAACQIDRWLCWCSEYTWIFRVLQQCELFVIYITSGSKARRIVSNTYKNYNHFFLNTWDFEPVFTCDIAKSCRKILSLISARTKKDKLLRRGETM